MTIPRPVSNITRYVWLSLLALVSGLCWYLGNGLTGDFWYLTWLAPIPILISSFYVSQRTSFWLAFAAYFLGRLSWFSYLETVVSLVPAVLLTLVLPYAFARIVVYSKKIILILNRWYTVLTYPVLMTSFEFLVATFSPDGTATSLAYPQAVVLPLIQITSLTGLLGVTFLVSFFPSVFALCWWASKRRKHWLPYLISSAFLVVGASFLYGFFRIKSQPVQSQAKAGLVVLPEKSHHNAQQNSLLKIRGVINDYDQAISQVVAEGATLVVLPETALRLSAQNRQMVLSSLQRIAQHKKVALLVGLADYSQPHARNTALVIDSTGTIMADYTKNHLVSGFERQFTPGHQVGLFTLPTGKAGVAICKDLDFPSHIRRYGRAEINALFVPANDFVVDDWLHSRMAILRGVENGFPVVRVARQGRLSISDRFGRVLYEANAAKGGKTLLIGTVPYGREATPYTYAGDWFGLINLVLAIYGLWTARRKERVERQSAPLPTDYTT